MDGESPPGLLGLEDGGKGVEEIRVRVCGVGHDLVDDLLRSGEEGFGLDFGLGLGRVLRFRCSRGLLRIRYRFHEKKKEEEKQKQETSFLGPFRVFSSLSLASVLWVFAEREKEGIVEWNHIYTSERAETRARSKFQALETKY